MVTSSYPFHRDDFHARFLHEMAVALVARGARVEVLSPATPGGAVGPERWDGVEIVRFPYPGREGAWAVTGGDGIWMNLRSRPARAWSLPGLQWNFVRRVGARLSSASGAPDWVLSHWLVPGALAVAAAKKTARPVRLAESPPVKTVHFAHGSDVALLRHVVGGRSLARALARDGTLVAVSPYLANQLAGLIGCEPRDIPVVPLGVGDTACGPLGNDSSPARAASAATRVRHSDTHLPLRLCAMTRLIPGKGLDRLLDTVALLPGASLEIAGAGGERTRIEERVRRERLRVTLLGTVLGEEKAAFLNRGDLFLCLPDAPDSLSSLGDNLPVSVLEAMAAGIPVAATSVGALTGLLSGQGGGWLVEADPAAIAARLSALSRQDLATAARRARERGELWSWERSLEALASIRGVPSWAPSRHPDSPPA